MGFIEESTLLYSKPVDYMYIAEISLNVALKQT